MPSVLSIVVSPTGVYMSYMCYSVHDKCRFMHTTHAQIVFQAKLYMCYPYCVHMHRKTE